jgi:hypothetical protein
MAEALLAQLVALHCRADGPFAGQEAEAAARLRGELETGMWLSAAGPDGALLAWLAWVETDTRGLALLQRFDFEALAARGLLFRIRGGAHVYVMDVVVAPGAPRGLYRALLYRHLPRRVPGALSISGHMVRPDGRRTFHIRRPDGRRWREEAEAA